MKARLLVALNGDPTAQFPDATRPVGTVIDHPDAYKLVRRGCADPADEECRIAADMTPEQLRKAQEHYPIVHAGVIPEDYDAWRRGYMRGYNPDGSWKPGPNWDEYVGEEHAQRAEDAGIVLP